MPEQREGKVLYNKLVTDGIPNKLKARDIEFSIRRIQDDDEYFLVLLDKLVEEAREVRDASDRASRVKEMVDLLMVIREIERVERYADSDIGNVALMLRERRGGGFKKRLLLEWVQDTGYEADKSK